MSEPPPAGGRRSARQTGAPRPRGPRPRTLLAVSRLSPAWRRLLPGAAALARRAARAALAGAAARDGRGPRRAAELSLVLADDRLVHHLNRQYRHIDKPTNVLSFPGGIANPQSGRPAPGPMAAPEMLGDVVLAAETVAAESAAQGKAVADHFSHLVVHGVLHLLGYDHLGRAEAAAMESLEVEVLAGLGIADPYRAAAPAAQRRAASGPARPKARRPDARRQARERGAVSG